MTRTISVVLFFLRESLKLIRINNSDRMCSVKSYLHLHLYHNRFQNEESAEKFFQLFIINIQLYELDVYYNL